MLAKLDDTEFLLDRIDAIKLNEEQISISLSSGAIVYENLIMREDLVPKCAAFREEWRAFHRRPK